MMYKITKRNKLTKKHTPTKYRDLTESEADRIIKRLSVEGAKYYFLKTWQL